MDTVRRSIQRASALTASDLKKGISRSRRSARRRRSSDCSDGRRRHHRVPGHRGQRLWRHRRVSAGIAEALVETALGLVVAIPAVWFYN
jgi:hypothetical protein